MSAPRRQCSRTRKGFGSAASSELSAVALTAVAGGALGGAGGVVVGGAAEPVGGEVVGVAVGGAVGWKAGYRTGHFLGDAAGEAGDWLLSKAGNLVHEVSTPFRGVPGSTTETRKANGELKHVRRYGPDGFPETDVDTDHDHGQGCPHAHDWARPPGGGPPTNADRGVGRPVIPTDPKPE